MPNYDEMDDIYSIFGLGGDISIDRDTRDNEDDDYKKKKGKHENE